MPSCEALEDEDRRIRQLQIVVSLALNSIADAAMEPSQAWDLVLAVRGTALRLFPGKELAFDLIYLPRFLRLLAHRYPGAVRPRFG